MEKRLTVFGYDDHQENTLEQFMSVADRAQHAALMADGHKGYDMPIGGVAAYCEEVTPSGVGFRYCMW